MYHFITTKPGHSIYYKIVCASTKDSDQSMRLRSPINVFADHLKMLWLLGYPLHAIGRL